MKLGHKLCSWPVYAADVTDPVLLGLDFFVKNKCKVEFVNNEILPDEIIVATLKKGTEGNTCDIFKVISVRHQCIPPNTKLKIPVQVLNAKSGITQCVVEPGRNLKGLVASNAIIPPHGYIDVINDSNHNIIVKYQQHIGTALEMIEVLIPWLATNNLKRNSTRVYENSCQQLPECSVRMASTSKSILDTDAPKSITDVSARMPEHLQELFNNTKNDPPEEHVRIIGELLIEFQDVFAKHDLDLGYLSAVKHKIDTRDSPPVRHRIRRTSLGFEDEERKHLDKMLAAGVIRPSASEWASALVLVQKKDGRVRWCVKDKYPLSPIEDCLDTLSGTLYFSTLDLASGYYQIGLEEESIKKTVFITKYGLFEHTRLGFGLCNAPAIFQRAMN